MKYLNRLQLGLVLLLLSTAVMGIGLAVANLLAGTLVINFNVNNDTDTNTTVEWQLIAENKTDYFYVYDYDNNWTELKVVCSATEVALVKIEGNYTGPVEGARDDVNGTWKATLYTLGNYTVGSYSSATGSTNFQARVYLTSGYLRVGVSSHSEYRDYYIQYNGTSIQCSSYTIYGLPSQQTQQAQLGTTLDLSFIPGLLVIFGGLLMFIRGLQLVSGTRF